MVRRSLLALPALLLVGCLDFDFRSSIRPDGLIAGHMVMSAPKWLLTRWKLEGTPYTPSEQLALQSGVRIKQTGRGVWIAADALESWRSDFLAMRWEHGQEQWTFAATLQLSPSDLEAMRNELQKRALSMPKMHDDKANRLAGSVYNGSSLGVELDFPFEVTETNGKIKDGLVSWHVTLGELEDAGGTKILSARGPVSSLDQWMVCLAGLLPGTELD